ncbi:hypothetical protein ACQEV9_15575 [Streptomyces chartreusis]|uniref:hypothetical protein n=1 Tax=Streptomyces chartreusis TaxID=1969 RepID=UPI003D950488
MMDLQPMWDAEQAVRVAFTGMKFGMTAAERERATREYDRATEVMAALLIPLSPEEMREYVTERNRRLGK